MAAKDPPSDQNELFPGFDVLEARDGGMGRVYTLRYHDRSEGKAVAKTLRPKFAQDARYFRRFIEEAQLFMSVPSFPFLGSPIALVTEGRSPYLLMHWIDGMTLMEWASRDREPIDLSFRGPADWSRWWERWLSADPKPFHPAGLLFYLYQICLGLEWLYSHSVKSHGDLHGNNIMIRNGPQAHAQLIDLGLASAPEFFLDPAQRILGENDKVLAGCLPYMAPELMLGEDAPSVGSDMYALGVTMYHALCQKFPYASPPLPFRGMEDDSKPSAIDGVSERYRDLILRCISLRTEDRFQDVTRLMEAVVDVLGNDFFLTINLQARNYTDEEQKELDELAINKSAAIAASVQGREESERVLRDVIARRPKHHRARQVLAQLLYDAERLEEAEEQISEASSLDSTDFFVLNTKGIILMAQELPDQAAEVLHAAVEAAVGASQRSLAATNLSKALRSCGRDSEADRWLDQAEGSEDNSFTNRERARLHALRADWEAAEEASRRAVALDPTDGQAWGILGDALAELDRHAEAYDAYREGLIASPDNAGMLVEMAHAAALSGRSRGEILAVLDQAEALGHKDERASRLRRIAQQETDRDTEAENLGRISVPIGALEELGLPMDQLQENLGVLFDLIKVVQNSPDVLTARTVDSMLKGADRETLVAICDVVTSKMDADDKPMTRRVVEHLANVRQYLVESLRPAEDA